MGVAQWMGVEQQDLVKVLPNLPNFVECEAGAQLSLPGSWSTFLLRGSKPWHPRELAVSGLARVQSARLHSS